MSPTRVRQLGASFAAMPPLGADREWNPPGRPAFTVDLPETFDQEIQSWDLAFKDLETSDHGAGGGWGVKGADRYLVDQVRDHLGFPDTIEARIADDLKQAAIEEGQWTEKRELNGATGLSEIKARINAGRDRVAALKKERDALQAAHAPFEGT